MKRIIAFGMALLLAACAPRETFRTPPSPETARVSVGTQEARPFGRVRAAPAAVGDQALADIRSWYNDTVQNCGGATAPSFVCSGVMLRATETNPAFLPWDPSPGSVASGGISASWIRADTNFSDLVYNYWNGFILYPPSRRPGGSYAPQVLCVFPMDAATNGRPSDAGCGAHGSAPSTSAPCDDQGITTSLLWGAHFIALPNKYSGQCGWDMRQGAVNTADRFIQSVKARSDLAAQWWTIQNELRLATWPNGTGKSLPIRAFFYVPGHAGALDDARNDQQRYRSSYGIDMPIIRMTLPSSKGGRASFAYSEADQGGGSPPPGTLPVTFEDAMVQGPTDYIVGSNFIAEQLPRSVGKVVSIATGSSPSGVVHGRFLNMQINGGVAEAWLHLPKAVTRATFSYWKSNGDNTLVSCLTASNEVAAQVVIKAVEGRVSCNSATGFEYIYVYLDGASGHTWSINFDDVTEP